MLIGVPKEVKNHEYRVALTPAGVHELVAHGHQVWVQNQAGEAIGFTDAQYRRAGAELIADADKILAEVELILKVKEPQPQEYQQLHAGQILFTYLHLAADKALTQGLMDKGVTAIAYETVTDQQQRLPLLTPMSEIAGRMSVQAGAHCLHMAEGGKGVLLPGVPGVEAGRVAVLGAGTVGINAARVAMGLGAQVQVLDISLSRLQEIDSLYGPRLQTLHASKHNLAEAVANADLVIGAVLVPGAKAPKLISRALLKQMQPGSVVVDVAIDQGGCMETSQPTTHQNPTFVEEGVVHYCVANMPGAVARTATQALTNATLPYIVRLAEAPEVCLQQDPLFSAGVNVYQGTLVNQAVAEALDLPWQSFKTLG